MNNKLTLDRDKVDEGEISLIAPCGIYCGACDTFLGRSSELAKELHRILDGFNFADVGPFLMRLEPQRIRDFLDILGKMGQRDKCPGCWHGSGDTSCGNPNCSIRVCAGKQGFLTCAECGALPCYSNKPDKGVQLQDSANYLALVSKRYAYWNIGNLERIKEVGYRQFIDELQDKVRKGFMTCDIVSSEMVVTEALMGNAQEPQNKSAGS